MNHPVGSARAERLGELLLLTSRTFALSIPELPEPQRREVTVAYLLFRVADTLEDATLWTAERQDREMARLADLVQEPVSGSATGLAREWVADPPLEHDGYLELLAELPLVVASLEELKVGARELVRAHTLRTIERMATFVRRPRPLVLRDVTDLRDYCYAVAGIVGEMLTELFLHDRPALAGVAPRLRRDAARFGEALQLVNILKDSASDAREGRRYVPPGVERAELLELARGNLEAASGYVRALQRTGAPRGIVAFTALPVLLAWRTLDCVERVGPGAKLTRAEVAGIARVLDEALDEERPVVPAAWSGY